jgi:hypothetical protein
MTRLLTFLLCFAFLWHHGRVIAVGSGNSFRITTFQEKFKSAATTYNEKAKSLNKRCLDIRGGDLGPISGKALAQSLCILGAGDAVCGALAPRTSLKWMGIELSESNRLAYHYVHGIGASAAALSISLYLSVSDITTLAQAIGYGFLLRLLSMAVLLLTNQSKYLGMNDTIFMAVWLALAVTTFTLFTGKWEPMIWVKVVSLLLGVHGFFLYGNPTSFVQKASGGKSKATVQQGKMKESERV